MKLYKKTDLELVNGRVVDKTTNEVIGIEYEIISGLNYLETNYQKAKWLELQPKGIEAPNLDGFVRQSETKSYKVPDPETPIQDRKVKEGLELANELDAVSDTKILNDYISKYADILRWVDNDTVTDCGSVPYELFDTPTLGNVLALTADDLIDAMKYINGIKAPEVKPATGTATFVPQVINDEVGS